ncbi:MAG: TolC family protein [Archangium sp.]|nr:TolC family protein [Archangium sp.]
MKTAAAVMTALVSLSAFADGDLKSFIDAAHKENIDRRISIEQRNKAAWDFTAAWGSLLPALTVQGGWTHNQFGAELNVPRTDADGKPILQRDDNGQYVITPALVRDTSTGVVTFNPHVGTATPEYASRAILLQDQLSAVFRIDVPVIDVARWIRVAGAGINKESAELREAYMKDVITRQVVGAYYGYAAALALKQSAEKSLAAAEAQAKLMEIRTQVGSTTELDLARARAEVQRNRQLVADSVSLIATSRRALRTLTSVEPPDSIPEWADNMAPEGALDELEKRIDQLPLVQASDKEAKAGELASTGAALTLVPTVSANFSENISNATGFTGQNATYSFGLNATWRIDVPTVANINSTGALANQAKLAAEKTRLQSRDQVNSDFQRFTAALIKIEAAKAQVAAAGRAAQVSRDRYAVGSATQIEVIQAERDLFTSELGQIQARTELATARASLRLSAALPLE